MSLANKLLIERLVFLKQIKSFSINQIFTEMSGTVHKGGVW